MKIILPMILLLAACSSVVPETVNRLSSLSPIEADPEQIEILISLPDGIDLPAGGASLTLSAAKDSQTTTGHYVLSRSEVTSVEDGIGNQTEGHLLLYRIENKDIPNLRAQQRQIRAWKAENDATEGSLSVSLSPCIQGEPPAEDAKGSVWIRTENDGPFLQLVKSAPIRQLLDADTIAGFRLCD